MRKFMRNNFSAFVLAFAFVILSLAFGTIATTWATEISTITVGGTDYVLYTGFTATAGTASYGNFVDGNLSNNWTESVRAIFILPARTPSVR